VRAITALLLGACAVADAAPRAPLPAGNAVLLGGLCAQTPPAVRLVIRLDPARPSGTVSYDGVDTFTLVKPRLEVLAVRSVGPGVLARYRLQYQIDVCEHRKPVAAITGWDVCFYLAGQPRPVYLVTAELLMTRNRSGGTGPGSDIVQAAGTDDVMNLSNAFTLRGLVSAP
jgi:hypothetical protein